MKNFKILFIFISIIALISCAKNNENSKKDYDFIDHEKCNKDNNLYMLRGLPKAFSIVKCIGDSNDKFTSFYEIQYENNCFVITEDSFDYDGGGGASIKCSNEDNSYMTNNVTTIHDTMFVYKENCDNGF